MSQAGGELARELHAARTELARIVEGLERGALPIGATQAIDAAIAAVDALGTRRSGTTLDAHARRECAALLDLVGVARGLASAQFSRARAELSDVRAVRARLGRQRERLIERDTRNCDVSA